MDINLSQVTLEKTKKRTAANVLQHKQYMEASVKSYAEALTQDACPHNSLIVNDKSDYMQVNCGLCGITFR